MVKPRQVDESELLSFAAEGQMLVGRSGDGEEYIGSTSDYYIKPRIDGQKLKDIQDNYFVAVGLNDLQEKLFTQDLQIHYYDANDEEDAAFNRQIEKIFAKCDLDARIRQSYSDIYVWGPYLYEPIWGNTTDGWVAPIYLTPLPLESFIEPPQPAPPEYTFSEILKGICYNSKTKMIEFWQLQTDGKSHLLKNVVMLKNPTVRGIAGKSRLIPIVPLVTLASFCFKATHQRVNRIGAPALFIRFLSTPKPLGTSNEMELAKLIINNWGKDNQYMLTNNMELVELKSPDNRSANDTIELLDKLIKRYFNAAAMMEKEGPTIGGNSAAQAGMVSTTVQSILKWVAKLWLPLIEEFMARNGFSGGRVELILPVPEPDRTEINLKIAETADRTGVATTNEIREKLGLPEATPEILAEIEGRNKAKTPAPAFGMPQQQGGPNPPPPPEQPEETKAFSEELDKVEQDLANELEKADDKALEKIVKAMENEKGVKK